MTETIAAGDTLFMPILSDTYTLGGPGEPAGQLAFVMNGTASYTIVYKPPSGGE